MLNLSSLRSVLFVSGGRLDRVEKALATAADLVCIDLEDSVSPSDKAEARNAMLQLVSNGPNQRLAVRMNSLTTRTGLEDLLALSGARFRPVVVLLPKVEAASELSVVTGAFDDPGVGIVPLIESAEGLSKVGEIARARGCAAIMFGGADFAADIGSTMEWESLLVARSLVVQAAARACIPAIDVPYLDVEDLAGLALETHRARGLGFGAKAAIHPSQIKDIHRAFLPAADEIVEAQAAVAAYRGAGGGVAMFNGKMIDAPVVSRYERVLALVSATRIPKAASSASSVPQEPS